MKMLMVGTGGVGEAIARILKERDPEGIWMEQIIFTSSSTNKAKQLAKEFGNGGRYIGEHLDARDKDAIIELVKKYECNLVFDAAPPFVTNTVFDAAYEAGCNYMNMGTWSDPGPNPYEEGYELMMADYNFHSHAKWQEKGQLAVIGVGIDPGVVDVFAKFAAKHLFDELTEIHVRDGNNLRIEGIDVAFGFNVWTVLDECLNPNVEWRKWGGFLIDKPFSGSEYFDFPEGVGLQKVYKVEHEEVVFMPKYLSEYGLKRCTFKIALDDNLVNALKVIEMLGLRDTNRRIDMDGKQMSPRDIIARIVTQPTDLAQRMSGKMCVGIEVSGKKDGMTRNVFIYQALGNDESMKRMGCQAVVAQTGFGAAIAIECVARGLWKGTGVHAPEFFEPEPYLQLMDEYEFPYGFCEWDSEYENSSVKDYFTQFYENKMPHTEKTVELKPDRKDKNLSCG